MRNSKGQFVKGHKQPKEWEEKRIAAIKKIRRENHHGWLGDNISYEGIHDWLFREFGSASKCENKKCHGNCDYYNWALKRGCEYERKRENFIELCRSCHNIYDGIGMKRKAKSKFKGVAWQKQIGKWRAYINFNKKQIHIGVFVDEEAAAKAYNKKAKELYGDIAYLNNIK